MITVGQLLKLVTAPDKVPELICGAMPGGARALALMDAHQRLTQAATEAATASFNAMAKAVRERRDLSKEETNAVALATHRVLSLAFEIQELTAKPIVTIAELSRIAAE